MGRNPEKNQQVKEKRREQILRNALSLFARKGLAATKISDIAAQSGISQGLLYRYFSSKEAVFTELIRDAFDKLNSACETLEAMEIPPDGKIRLAASGLLQGLEENEEAALYHLLIAQANATESIPEEAREILEKSYRNPYEVIARIFKAGQRDGLFRDDEPGKMSLLFWSTINGLAIYRAVHGGWFTRPDPEIIMRMFLVQTDTSESEGKA